MTWPDRATACASFTSPSRSLPRCHFTPAVRPRGQHAGDPCCLNVADSRKYIRSPRPPLARPGNVAESPWGNPSVVRWLIDASGDIISDGSIATLAAFFADPSAATVTVRRVACIHGFLLTSEILA